MDIARQYLGAAMTAVAGAIFVLTAAPAVSGAVFSHVALDEE